MTASAEGTEGFPNVPQRDHSSQHFQAAAPASISGLFAAIFYGMMRVTRDTYETTRGALADKRMVMLEEVPPVASVGSPDVPSRQA